VTARVPAVDVAEVVDVKRWHRLYDCCTVCRRTDRPHQGYGKCTNCYQKWKYATDPKTQRTRKLYRLTNAKKVLEAQAAAMAKKPDHYKQQRKKNAANYRRRKKERLKTGNQVVIELAPGHVATARIYQVRKLDRRGTTVLDLQLPSGGRLPGVRPKEVKLWLQS
jgi:hypothetical protein